MAPKRRRATGSWTYKGEGMTWRPTTTMNAHDLSNDDDFVSHMLVEKLGTGDVPLLVHRMDPMRRLPKTSTEELLDIVRKLVTSKGNPQAVIRQAVDRVLALVGVQYYIRQYTQKQINAFATHTSRYFEFYMPTGSIEISHTSRYSHKTGKSELCILATKPLQIGHVVTELKGSMADLTPEEERKLKYGDARATGLGMRKDFSVIHSRQKNMNHLFLGPARFVNHDCDNNAELFRDGRCITFRVIKPIALGEEVTTHYGDGYFGSKNKDCLCATCERRGVGGYAPVLFEGEDAADSMFARRANDSDSDSDDSSSLASVPEAREPVAPVNIDERSTRRGVYHVLPKQTEAESDPAEPSDEQALASDTIELDSSDGEVQEIVPTAAQSSSAGGALTSERQLTGDGVQATSADTELALEASAAEAELTEPPPAKQRPPVSSASSSLTSLASTQISRSSLSSLSTLSDASGSSSLSRISAVSTITTLSVLEKDDTGICGPPPGRLLAIGGGPGSSPLSVSESTSSLLSGSNASTQRCSLPRLDRAPVSLDAVSLSSSSTAVEQGAGAIEVARQETILKDAAEAIGTDLLVATAQVLPAHLSILNMPKKRGRPSNAMKAAMKELEDLQRHDALQRGEKREALAAAQAVGDRRSRARSASRPDNASHPGDTIDLTADSNDSDGDSGSETDEEAITRALRPRRALPARFYDLVKRRAPRKHFSGSAPANGTSPDPSASLAGESASAPVRNGHLPGPSRLRTELVNSASEGTPTGAADPESDGELAEEEAPLPKCRICKAIIPVICVDSEIIWGPDDDDDENQECPRCMRHWAIYGVRWPHRVLKLTKHGGSMFATPQGSSTPVDTAAGRKVTRTMLPVIDRKLADAASSASDVRVSRKGKDRNGEPPAKRRKLASSSKGRDSEPAEQDEPPVSPSTARSSGRARVPSHKVRNGDTASKRKPGRPRKHPLPEPVEEPVEKRGPGRPRKRPRSPSPMSESKRKHKSGMSKTQAVRRQPRDNGRFGKKADGTLVRPRRPSAEEREALQLARAERIKSRDLLKLAAENRANTGTPTGEDDDGWVTESEGMSTVRKVVASPAPTAPEDHDDGATRDDGEDGGVEDEDGGEQEDEDEDGLQDAQDDESSQPPMKRRRLDLEDLEAAEGPLPELVDDDDIAGEAEDAYGAEDEGQGELDDEEDGLHDEPEEDESTRSPIKRRRLALEASEGSYPRVKLEDVDDTYLFPSARSLSPSHTPASDVGGDLVLRAPSAGLSEPAFEDKEAEKAVHGAAGEGVPGRQLVWSSPLPEDLTEDGNAYDDDEGREGDNTVTGYDSPANQLTSRGSPAAGDVEVMVMTAPADLAIPDLPPVKSLPAHAENGSQAYSSPLSSDRDEDLASDDTVDHV